MTRSKLNRNTSRNLVLVVLVGLLATGLGGCGEKSNKITVAYVTNGVASFWTIAEKGAEAAAKEFDVEVDVLMPPNALAQEQKEMLENLIAKGVQGIAVSPIHGEHQTDLVNQCQETCPTITQDSDAPSSKRLCYVGMDNYDAGRMCGKLVKEAVPNGGKIMIFVGRLSQANAKGRRQGLIDELMDRSHDPKRWDAPGEPVSNDKYTILDTRTDNFNNAKAKANAEDTIARHPDLACMVGLFAYNPPQCLEAIKGANKLNQIKVVAFDEDDKTLAGIRDGTVHGTIVQDPYRYGYESVRILAALARDDQSVLPENKFFDIPARSVKKANLDEFWDQLKARLGTN
ncbi:MAG: sugar ABC transporter substrate-binding protein [Phycisphaeraceae bacterium]|nr:sugar ABC transporter substrate-binding protein [Phycisphaeraceae bacterium]